MTNKIKQIILLVGDIIVLYLTLYLTLLTRYLEQPTTNDWQIHFGPFTWIFVFWLIIFYISDLYNLNLAVNNARFFKLTIRSEIIAGALSAVFFYINPSINIAPKTNLIIYLVIFFILFILWRRFFNYLLHAQLPKNNILVIGANNQVSEILKLSQEKPHLGYFITDIIDTRDESEIGNLKEKIKNKKIDTIVLASSPHESLDLRSELFSCLPLNIRIINLPNFYEEITGKVPIEAINQMWFLENLSQGKKTGFDLFKRIYDFILALAIFITTLPFWLIIAIIIKLESKGPVFYLSVRTGRNNRIFKLIKFRTMREDNNDRSLTRANDPRITKFGSIIRKTRIDEIPQVINVLKGQVSFVGPRPERPELIKELEKVVPFYNERLLVKPGLTGWDQVSGEYHSPSVEDTIKKIQYDLFYIKNRSIYLDLSIILKTIATVLSRSGI